MSARTCTGCKHIHAPLRECRERCLRAGQWDNGYEGWEPQSAPVTSEEIRRANEALDQELTAQPPSLPVPEGFETFAQQAAEQAASGRGLRFNAGKSRVDLLPPDAIKALADLMTINEHKYPDRNWERGMPWSDILASCERHMLSLKAGEDIDPTDNQHHAVKIMWNGMAMFCYWFRQIGTDDRVKVALPEMRPIPTNG